MVSFLCPMTGCRNITRDDGCFRIPVRLKMMNSYKVLKVAKNHITGSSAICPTGRTYFLRHFSGILSGSFHFSLSFVNEEKEDAARQEEKGDGGNPETGGQGSLRSQ